MGLVQAETFEGAACGDVFGGSFSAVVRCCVHCEVIGGEWVGERGGWLFEGILEAC